MKKLFILLCLFLSACATFPETRTREREGDNTGQASALTVQQEEQLTREALPEMQKQYPPLNDPELQAYVRALGKKLVMRSHLEGNPYRYNFTVVNVDYVNAFALPAGTVFVTAPLIKMTESEAELAGVLGHEIGHVKARHTAERMEKAKQEQGSSWLYGAGGGVTGAAAGFGLAQLLCKGDRNCVLKMTAGGAAVGAAGGLLVQKFKFMQNSREDEMEADRIGFKVAVAAGYDKDQVGRFYSKLLQMEKQRKSGGDPVSALLGDALSTHPPSEERVAQMNEMARTTAQGKGALSSSPEYLKIKARLGAK